MLSHRVRAIRGESGSSPERQKRQERTVSQENRKTEGNKREQQKHLLRTKQEEQALKICALVHVFVSECMCGTAENELEISFWEASAE